MYGRPGLKQLAVYGDKTPEGESPSIGDEFWLRRWISRTQKCRGKSVQGDCVISDGGAVEGKLWNSESEETRGWRAGGGREGGLEGVTVKNYIAKPTCSLQCHPQSRLASYTRSISFPHPAQPTLPLHDHSNFPSPSMLSTSWEPPFPASHTFYSNSPAVPCASPGAIATIA
ncbi:hypothetical protein BDN72DRAFT_831193 [Pluteus cervinus]|uniref:Uncharacterized protein n=1 Tax=Pluteus cervinus TaxID=181527 RepID=A0ACD3BD27_9AGAR|nr:hypothetical protein BDN72DRAFT_831193 [Pluteus cervinus]